MKGCEKVELYKCSYCQEFHADKEELVGEHLKECVANPDNKSCVMCKYICNYNDMESNRPLKYYKCEKNNRVLEDFDLYALGAECFEERDTLEMVYSNSEKYSKYLENLTNNIMNNIEK